MPKLEDKDVSQVFPLPGTRRRLEPEERLAMLEHSIGVRRMRLTDSTRLFLRVAQAQSSFPTRTLIGKHPPGNCFCSIASVVMSFSPGRLPSLITFLPVCRVNHIPNPAPGIKLLNYPASLQISSPPNTTHSCKPNNLSPTMLLHIFILWGLPPLLRPPLPSLSRLPSFALADLPPPLHLPFRLHCLRRLETNAVDPVSIVIEAVKGVACNITIAAVRGARCLRRRAGGGGVREGNSVKRCGGTSRETGVVCRCQSRCEVRW